MGNEIKKLVDDSIVELIEYRKALPDGSDEKAQATEELIKLCTLRHDERRSLREYIKLGLEAGTLVLTGVGLGVKVWSAKTGWKNEADGYYPSSPTFKQLFSSLFKTKE